MKTKVYLVIVTKFSAFGGENVTSSATTVAT